MNRIEPTMPSNTTLQKIAHATGDFEQIYRAPTKYSVVATDIEKISQASTEHAINASTLIKLSELSMGHPNEEKDLDLILNQFYCSLTDQRIRLNPKSDLLLIELAARAFALNDFHSEVMAHAKANDLKESNQSVEEQDLELDENSYLLNQLSPLAYKAA